MNANFLKQLFSLRNVVRRAASTQNFFVAKSAHLRRTLETHQLADVHVVILHKDAKAVLVSKILNDHGASIKNFVLKGVEKPIADAQEIDFKDADHLRLFENILKKSDVFVNGVGDDLAKLGFDKQTVARRFGQLIVTSIEGYEAFHAMSAVKSVAISLYLREKYCGGQVINDFDHSSYKTELDSTYQAALRK